MTDHLIELERKRMVREANRERKRLADERHRRDAVRCARCGYVRANVIHDTDREHAPEGLAYYATVPFCEFESVGEAG